MKFSYSRISCFGGCPYQYKLRYIDKLKTIPETNADNALYLGLALHKGIEEDVEAGLAEYKSHFNVLTDEHINWLIQLEYQLPKVKALLPKGEHEVEITTDEFVGYIDLLECVGTDENGITHYNIWDFKYSNNVDNYSKSPQLSIYAHYYEQTHPNTKIDHCYFVMIPKVQIRQKHKAKPPETIQEFRIRLREHLDATEIKVIEVNFDDESVSQFKQCCQLLKTVENFPKNQTKLCNWCQYKTYCESDGKVDWMII